jgi:uncharacterized membrane protein YedE/YeeE
MSTITKKIDFTILGYAILGTLLFSYLFFSQVGNRHLYVFLIGIGLGVSLYHASFGFTGGWRNFIENRESASLRAQIIMLALAIILFSFFIGTNSWIYNGKMIGAVAPVSVSVIVGSFMFGLAMQLAGGCGSGTLFTASSGNGKMAITLVFFMIGSLVGTHHFDFWRSLPSLGGISLMNEFGKTNSVLLQVSILIVLYYFIYKSDQKRNSEFSHLDIFNFSNFDLLKGPWPLILGALLLVFFNVLMLQAAGHPWGITFAFGLWAAKIVQFLGVEVSSWSFWKLSYPSTALENSLFADPTTVSNLGIIFGALAASALAGNFFKTSLINKKILIAAILGGFFMGYGARLSFGCNVGALFSGIASGSLHGWVWFLFAFIGSIFGVKFRRIFYS